MLLDDGLCFHDDEHARCLQMLLDRGLLPRERLTVSDDYDAYPLHLAAGLVRSNCVRILATASPQFVNRADNRGYTPLLYALGAVDEARIKDRHDAPGWSKAMTATVAALLEARADPELDIPFHAPLFLACGINGSVECTRMLLDAGANPVRRSAKLVQCQRDCPGDWSASCHRPHPIVNVVSTAKNTTACIGMPTNLRPGYRRVQTRPQAGVARYLDSRADVLQDDMDVPRPTMSQ